MSDKEKINHPKHYNTGKIEVIDFIDDQKLGFCLGNCIKYITRANHKHDSPKEDLLKARWYLQHEIKRLGFEDQKNEDDLKKKLEASEKTVEFLTQRNSELKKSLQELSDVRLARF